ncbi:FAD:protein FMN transferase (plasmid) [Azospirillum brasilense]|uniref:FAD:protein FMN transferase n=1 Tax=Azospirillum brasilense TaxID=192 RepID=A0A4D8R171_AZOBR|nr:MULTISPECIES: FAD:protein FMN transferase [Azospirillum]MDW7555479.1 FAD:protein FMN transferase [Azospirillum brasilense]MDW7595113.1 FAD:protein FMN transferase [Azospirillum brasilense]MDW7630266.1 FAD:protein FMN transferase [Azospirillum brasilense]MDX5949634.1 FAD:protein FMN transferase [Azospirillum brasilense]OPH19113.1 thiamine biosynthesis protein ApbE [Azospirillum brasilense]
MTTRRRFLGIAAVAAGLALLPGGLRAAGVPVRTWRGVALGADSVIQLAHPDPAEADRLIALCLEEVARLERIFSLYRTDSALVRLNRDGVLEAPPADLVRLLSEAAAFSRRTDGAFDPTVQPLWQLYAGHFARPGADPAGPPEAVLRAARELVDHRKLRVEPGRVAFAGRGMAVTLNGIAQGYVTDRVSERLRAEGMTDVLVDLGEIRALGHHPSGRPWSVGLADPLVEGRNAGTLEIAERAVATSGGYGTPFDAAGRFTHLFDPATGGCAREWLAVTVLAPDATTADALSTALSVAPEARAAVLLDRFPGTAARLTRRDGSVLALRA